MKSQPGTAFAKDGYKLPSGNFKVVYAKITNTSDREQKYDTFQFSAVTKAGVVIEPQIFAPYESQGLWYDSTLAPGGMECIVLLFAQDAEIIVLRHAPSSVSVSIPEPIN